MITVSAALDHLFALVSPLDIETVSLRKACGRNLAGPVVSKRTQPPFAASSMDGYALKAAEVEQDALFKVVGESAAGHGFDGHVGAGQAVRIFTGAPIPDGADFVVIQEDVDRRGDLINLRETSYSKDNIRAAGIDIKEGDSVAPSGPLTPSDIARFAMMNHATLDVYRRPVVALIPTGDELVQPGESPGGDQIIASNSFGLAALLEANGATARLIPIAKDTPDSLRAALVLAQDADLIITIGGASVGDHDLVGDVAADMGMAQSFYKIAMRPGKPLMAGRLNGTPMVGLPGNPVSAMVCGTVFVLPMIRIMLGQNAAPAHRTTAPLAAPITLNGPREHYMRAHLADGHVTAFDRQDSSLLSVMADANILVVRAPHDAPRAAGELVEIIHL